MGGSGRAQRDTPPNDDETVVRMGTPRREQSFAKWGFRGTLRLAVGEMRHTRRSSRILSCDTDLNLVTKRLQRGATALVHPLWLRVLATACLLLVGFVSSVEVVHIHGDLLPHHAAQVGSMADGSQLPGGEEHCPLCVAMHSTLPVSAKIAPVRLVLVACKLVSVVDRLPSSQWHFARFSRPPPVFS